MKFRFFLFILLINSCLFSNERDISFNECLQVELLKMCEEEQDLRKKWIYAEDEETKLEFQQKVMHIDDYHLRRLKEIIKEYGWPGYSLVGSKGSNAFWLLVQHTPDYAFQAECLEYLEQAVLDNNASKIDLAYLKDRVYMYAGKKQIYGTQLNADLTPYPIEDEDHINQRRQEVGLPTIEEYLKFTREMFRESILYSKEKDNDSS